MVRDTIQQYNLSILATHRPCTRSMDAVLEFIANSKPNHKRVFIRGKNYNITPKMVLEALKLGLFFQSNERKAKDWIKEYNGEVAIKALGETLCWLGQARWQGKKNKFQNALVYSSLKYPYMACIKDDKDKGATKYYHKAPR